jgi:hypothetical protein
VDIPQKYPEIHEDISCTIWKKKLYENQWIYHRKYPDIHVAISMDHLEEETL